MPAPRAARRPAPAAAAGIAWPSPSSRRITPAADDASDARPARKENTPPQRPAKGPALAAARVRERAKLKADAASAAAKGSGGGRARGGEPAPPNDALCPKSRAEFRPK